MHLPNRRQDTTRGQYTLIKQIDALTNLQITCDIASFPIDGILRYAQSLQSLRFRDYTGFSDEDRQCPTLDVNDLETMSRHLANLHTLELDMDLIRCEPQKRFLQALCDFPRLSTLTLHTQTVINPTKRTRISDDLDRKRATQMFLFLQSGRRSATSWRSITVNVGDWRPIMVRRLSAPWRALSSRGVHAERCFVMEQHEDGTLAIREKLPVRVYG